MRSSVIVAAVILGLAIVIAAVVLRVGGSDPTPKLSPGLYNVSAEWCIDHEGQPMALMPDWCVVRP